MVWVQNSGMVRIIWHFSLGFWIMQIVTIYAAGTGPCASENRQGDDDSAGEGRGVGLRVMSYCTAHSTEWTYWICYSHEGSRHNNLRPVVCVWRLCRTFDRLKLSFHYLQDVEPRHCHATNSGGFEACIIHMCRLCTFPERIQLTHHLWGFK